MTKIHDPCVKRIQKHWYIQSVYKFVCICMHTNALCITIIIIILSSIKLLWLCYYYSVFSGYMHRTLYIYPWNVHSYTTLILMTMNNIIMIIVIFWMQFWSIIIIIAWKWIWLLLRLLLEFNWMHTPHNVCLFPEYLTGIEICKILP